MNKCLQSCYSVTVHLIAHTNLIISLESRPSKEFYVQTCVPAYSANIVLSCFLSFFFFSLWGPTGDSHTDQK